MSTVQQGPYSRAEPALLPFFPRLIYLALKDKGFSEEELFEGLDLSPDQLQTESFRLSVAQHESFVLRALELTDNPHLALDMGSVRDRAAANVPLLAIANSGRVSEALRLVVRYNKTFTRVVSVHPSREHGLSAMYLEPHLEHESVIYFAVCSMALFLDRFFMEALDGQHLVKQLELCANEPPGFTAVKKAFGFPLRFKQNDNRILFKEALLDQPIQQADPQTVRLLRELSEQQLRDAEAELGIVGAVKTLMIGQLSTPPNLDEAAASLGISPRGLRRKLAESGTSYQKVLDAVRLAVATRLLTESELPVATIGFELGFANPSDFTRAFKRWTGNPPSSLR